MKLTFAVMVAIIAIVAGPHFSAGVRDAMLVLLAMSMGCQLAAIRYLKVPDLLTVVLTLTIIGALTEHSRGWSDPALLRRGLALVAFSVGALSGALLILNVSLVAALSFGLAIIVGCAIAAHILSREFAGWAAPRGA